MPNWCINHLAVLGTKDELKRFETMIKGPNGEIDFNKIVPYPARYKGYDGYNSGGGYEWCIENWGTKWNACRIEKEVYENHLFYIFETAWEPPLKIVSALNKEYPELEIELHYNECGNSFSGKITAKGNTVKEEFRPWCDCDECSKILEDFNSYGLEI